jgi:hypothetical protein
MFDETKSGGTADASSQAKATEQRAPTATDAIVEEWFAKHFHGLGARVDEFLFNHFRAAKEDLKSILARAHR